MSYKDGKHPLDIRQQKAEDEESSRMQFREEVLADVLPDIVTFVEDRYARYKEDISTDIDSVINDIIAFIENQN